MQPQQLPQSEDEEQPSYLRAMLTSATNLNLALTTLAASTFLSIPFGFAGAVLPLLAFAAGETIAAMFIPSSATFRHGIDRKYQLRRRERAMRHLSSEIKQRASKSDARWDVHARLLDRIASLREMARHRQFAMGERELERLDDAALDYLGLWLADLSMAERQRAVDERDIERRIELLGKRLEAGAADSRSLQKARADLEELLIRHRRLASRKAAVEAALLSLPDAVEEIYHAVVTTPASGAGGARLQEAIERLRLEEELESGYGAEIREILPQHASRMMSAARH